jgi:hypothetical protein
MMETIAKGKNFLLLSTGQVLELDVWLRFEESVLGFVPGEDKVATRIFLAHIVASVSGLDAEGNERTLEDAYRAFGKSEVKETPKTVSRKSK